MIEKAICWLIEEANEATIELVIDDPALTDTSPKLNIEKSKDGIGALNISETSCAKSARL